MSPTTRFKRKAWIATASAVALLSLAATAGAEEIDTSNPEVVKAYRDGFRHGATQSCMQKAEQSLAASGQPVDEPRKAKSEQLCHCMVDGISALVADAEITKLKTVSVDPALKPQREEIVAGCIKQLEPSGN